MSYLSFGELGYSSLYLPSVAYFYLWSYFGSGFEFQVWSTKLPASQFFVQYSFHIPGDLLLGLSLVTLLGAMVNHGLMRSIFGRQGPAENPKLKSEAFRNSIAIILWKDPSELPRTGSGLKFALAVSELIEGPLDLLKITARTSIILPAVGLQYFGYLALLLFISHLAFSDGGFIAGLITFSLFALLLRKHVWNYFPDIEQKRSDTGLIQPAFNREPFEPEGRKLGESRQKNSVSFRYRSDEEE